MLKYKVKGRNDIDDIQGCIFENRGISNPYIYMHLDDECLLPYNLLDNIDTAVKEFMYCMENEYTVFILQDSDTDGVTSATMIMNYIKKVFPKIKLKYAIHTGKQHGLSDIEIPIKVNTDTGKYDKLLVIVPDAGTNDTEECKKLSELGAKIIILDHHEKEKDNPYAIIVNNQISKNYDNKDFCGAGIVYKFLQAIDDEIWENYADDYLDLAMLGNISDIMDIRSFETKRIIEKGLHNIKNKCLKAFIKAQEYSIKDDLNINAVTFYITPLINAMCRVGGMDEKDILFRAFMETDEEFDYKKRGSNETVKESIYDRAVRLCKNAKSRQDNAVKKALPDLIDFVTDHNCGGSVMFVKADRNLPSTFTGLTAIKLADKYKHPCLVLRKCEDNTYRGSARNFDNCPIENLKDVLSETNLFEFCQGHQGAFGFSIKSENVKSAMEALDDKLKDVDLSTVSVDFEIDYDDFDIRVIKEVEDLKDYYGTGIKRPNIVIKEIPIRKNDGVVMGKESDSWKVIEDTNIAFVKFKVPKDDAVLEYLLNKENDNDQPIFINARCTVGFNEYEGIITPQAIIDEYEVI